MTGTKLFSRLISAALAFALIVSLLPGAALAATVTTEAGDFTVTTDVVNGYTYNLGDGVLLITEPGSYTIAMKSDGQTATATRIQINGGNVAAPINVTLDGVRIENNYCAFDLKPNSVLSLALKAGTTNTLQSQGAYPGLLCRNGAVLTIAGPGKLTATGGEYGAGIGGANLDMDRDGGTITITGGTVTATGGREGAGIGGGAGGGGGMITITGGTVTATGGQDGAGIGGGVGGGRGMITINGGTITANGGQYGAGIGGGEGGAGGDVYIAGGSVKAVGGQNGGEGIGKGKEGTDSGSLTNGSAPVYLTTVMLAGVNAETAVSALTCDTPYTYGMQDVKTDNEGKLYLYLPLDTKTTRASAGGRAYAGEVLTLADAASSQGTLTRVYTNDSPGYLHQTLQDPVTGVSLTGYFEPGARLTVTPKALHAEGTCAACDAIRREQKAGSVLALYDISASPAPYGAVELSFPVGTKYNGQTLAVLHCNNGVLEEKALTVQNGMATGSFVSLSPFAVLKTGRAGLLSIPKTGDNGGTGLGFVMLGASLALAGLAAGRCGKKRGTARG